MAKMNATDQVPMLKTSGLKTWPRLLLTMMSMP